MTEEGPNPSAPATARDRSTGNGAANSIGVPDEVPRELVSALSAAGVDPTDPQTSKVIAISAMLYSRPIPPPHEIVEYNQAVPGLGGKIVEWIEQQGRHRQGLERLRTEGSERRMNRGQAIAATVALFGLALAAAVGTWGNPWVASVIATVCVGGPTAAVALARNADSRRSGGAQS